MTTYKILKLTKKEILLDSGEIIKIDKDIIYEYDLQEGKMIKESTLKDIEFSFSLRYVYKILGMRDYTKFEIVSKLKTKGVSKNIQAKIIDRLSESKYLDDVSYIKNYISYKSYSSRRVIYELQKKGIKESEIKEILEQEGYSDKLQIEKYLKKIENKTKEQKIAYLLRQGFEYEDILDKI